MTDQRSLPQLTQHYLSQGSLVPAPVDLDPNKTNVLAERILNEMEDALAKDDTPLLHLVPRSDGVTWKMLIGAIVRESYRRMAEKDAKRPRRVAVEGITAANRGARAARKRLAQAIDGNKSNPRQSAMLRERIFASRTIVNNKAAWEAELRSEIAAIESLGDEAPFGVIDMLDVLKTALSALDASRAVPPGRVPRTTAWSTPVVEAAMALNLAIGDLVSSAASKATPKRNASLLRLAMPKRINEEKVEAGAEKKVSSLEKSALPSEPFASVTEMQPPHPSRPVPPGRSQAASASVRPRSRRIRPTCASRHFPKRPRQAPETPVNPTETRGATAKEGDCGRLLGLWGVVGCRSDSPLFESCDLMLGGHAERTRLNWLSRENIDEPPILRVLEGAFQGWANDRLAGERFGDFAVRTGLV